MYRTSAAAPPAAVVPAWKHSLFTAYLGWTLDAFDFLIMVMVLRDVPAGATAVGIPARLLNGQR